MTIDKLIQKGKENKWMILAFLMVLVTIIASLLFVTYSLPEKEETTNQQLDELLASEETSEELDGDLNEEESSTLTEETVSVIVDVKGAVRFPGVYELKETNRVIDAIEQAGGLLEDSDTRTLNFAKYLSDEMSIYVPLIGEDISELSIDTEKETAEAIININTAGVDQLTQLSGIGPKKAEEMIRYRENEAQFEKIEDIMHISGIGEKTFENIKEFIRVK